MCFKYITPFHLHWLHMCLVPLVPLLADGKLVLREADYAAQVAESGYRPTVPRSLLLCNTLSAWSQVWTTDLRSSSSEHSSMVLCSASELWMWLRRGKRGIVASTSQHWSQILLRICSMFVEGVIRFSCSARQDLPPWHSGLGVVGGVSLPGAACCVKWL